MMKKTNCSRIVTLHHAHNALVENIRKEIPGRQLVVDELPTPSYYAFPKLGSEIEADPFVPYPVPASRPDLDSPAIYFHSSGSTGFPKPILHTHIVQASWFMRRQSSLVRAVSLLMPQWTFSHNTIIHEPTCF
jgi:acyl-coenzyme A synthetase/AMP-(fatty) acid ligase